MAKRSGEPNAWDALHEFALGLPGAWEDFPWGEVVVKVNQKVFVFLGTKASDSRGMSVKLTDAHDHALSVPGAVPTGYGLGTAGWVSVPIGTRAADLEVLRDWVDESYRNVATKKFIAELDARQT